MLEGSNPVNDRLVALPRSYNEEDNNGNKQEQALHLEVLQGTLQ